MSITDKKLLARMLNREREKRKDGRLRFLIKIRRSRLWISLKKRYGIIELCKALALRWREFELRRQIENLGGFCKRCHWPEKNIELIRELRDELNKVRRQLRELKKERWDFHKSNKKGNFYTDYSPHFAAKLLGVDVVIVYRVLRMYAKTGNILFKGDMKLDACQGDSEDRAGNREQPQTHAGATYAKTQVVETKTLPENRLDIHHRDEVDESDFLPESFKIAVSHKRKRVVNPLFEWSTALWKKLEKEKRKRFKSNEKFLRDFNFANILSLLA